ncbi:ABC transporter ATP-binding protein [Paenibacillus sp. J31TS4]|uniref:ABC transporter ATP-binding protein n=1 Tax=Paenibacillus sp. J31TS4 TaxID=2807195 RepID=UPI001BCDDC18
MRVYFQFVKPYWKLIVLTLLIGMLKFAIPLTLPLIMKYVVDNLLLGDAPIEERLRSLLLVLGGAFVLFVVVRGPVEYYRQYFAQLVTSKILYDIRSRLYAHIQKLSLRYFHNHKVGEVISRFINDVEQTRNLVETGMMNVWLDLFTLVLVLIVMAFLNPMLTLVSVLIFPFYGLAVKILYKRLRTLTKERSQALAEIQGYLHERLQGIPVIRSFTLERYDEAKFGIKNTKYLNKALAQTRWNAMTFSIINTLTDIAPLLVIAYGGYEVLRGNLTVGSFVAFFGYLDRLYSPLRRLVNSSTTLTQASASLDRVLEFMNVPYDIEDAPGAKVLQPVQGEISFDRVSFRYNDKQAFVLKEIDLTIRAGETVALVGMSGGGKSSLISLIPRFYDIQEGAIRIDGQDIRGVTQESLREQIGMVLQDPILFSGSVRENILLGRPDATEGEIQEAAAHANAHDFIESLPKGYDTEIGERGVKLSGGQKQRIAIARVFLKNPRILVLDEATSALDLESEHLIQQAIEQLARSRTTIIVAHRLSTITHADRIVLIEHGQIKEIGCHDELMELDGLYAKLFNVQTLNHTPA